jgi:hypothetical protein
MLNRNMLPMAKSTDGLTINKTAILAVRLRLLAGLRIWYVVNGRVAELACLGVAFGTFVTATLFVVYRHHELDLSSLLTFGGGVQCLGFTCLALKVRSQGAVGGISAKSLGLYAGSFMFRLCSTLVKNGYLPTDKTGDWLYQLADIVSLATVVLVLLRMDALHQPDPHDTFPAMALVPACLVLGAFTYGDLNRSALFDFCWIVGTWMDTVAMLPQLFLIQGAGRKVPSLLSHYIAGVIGSRVVFFVFWSMAYHEMGPLDGSVNVCGYAVMTAYVVQLLLSADFMYQYLKSVAQNEPLYLTGDVYEMI